MMYSWDRAISRHDAIHYAREHCCYLIPTKRSITNAAIVADRKQ